MVEILHISSTPNPLARKFHADGLISPGKSLSFSDIASAASSPVAQALFSISCVRSVFILDQVITISIAHGADWDEIQPEIEVILREYLELPPVTNSAVSSVIISKPTDFFALELESQIAHIESVFDAKVRPGLAGDGGGLELMGIDGQTVYILYIGACGSCPSSTTGTLNFIRQTLREWANPAIEVELA